MKKINQICNNSRMPLSSEWVCVWSGHRVIDWFVFHFKSHSLLWHDLSQKKKLQLVKIKWDKSVRFLWLKWINNIRQANIMFDAHFMRYDYDLKVNMTKSAIQKPNRTDSSSTQSEVCYICYDYCVLKWVKLVEIHTIKKVSGNSIFTLN